MNRSAEYLYDEMVKNFEYSKIIEVDQERGPIHTLEMAIDFADENNGIIIGGDYSKPEENSKNKAITKDGGKTWTLVADGQNPNYKSCVQYVPSSNGKEVFAVGKTGVSFSNDGGLNWKEVSKEAYYTIQFVDKYTAWLAGNKKIGKLILK